MVAVMSLAVPAVETLRYPFAQAQPARGQVGLVLGEGLLSAGGEPHYFEHDTGGPIGTQGGVNRNTDLPLGVPAYSLDSTTPHLYPPFPAWWWGRRLAGLPPAPRGHSRPWHRRMPAVTLIRFTRIYGSKGTQFANSGQFAGEWPCPVIARHVCGDSVESTLSRATDARLAITSSG